MICTNKEGPGVEHQICDEEFVRLYKVLCPSQPFLQDGNTAWIVEISCLGCISAVFEGRRARKYSLDQLKCHVSHVASRFSDAKITARLLPNDLLIHTYRSLESNY